MIILLLLKKLVQDSIFGILKIIVFNKQEAKRTVDEMYHVKDGKKYIGEKYDM